MTNKYLINFLWCFFCFYIHGSVFAQGNSVLSDGDWYKISVVQDGIHKLSYSNLSTLNIDLDNLQISDIQLFGNGGGMIPKSNSEARYIDLEENAIQIVDQNGNNIFEEDDYILFFGQSPHRWKFNENTKLFEFSQHLYSDKTFYFLTISDSNSGKRILEKSIESNYNNTTSIFNTYKIHEKETENLIGSGMNWYGERFDLQNTQSFTFDFEALEETFPIYIKTSFAARSLNPSVFNVVVNGITVQQINISNIVNNYATAYAKTGSGLNSFYSSSSIIDVILNYNATAANSLGWLDYIELNAISKLKMYNNQILFRDVSSVDLGKVTKFNITEATNNVNVWDVSDPTNITSLNTQFLNDTLIFIAKTDSLCEYLAFDGTNYYSPVLEGSISNQNLHSLASNIEYVIISHPSFLSAAYRLADFHVQEDGLNTVVVNTEEIYNEFSSGSQDIGAIRDFLKMLYDRDNSRLKYTLLLGDGSYDPKDRIENNTNYIPTYQSANSTNPTLTYVTDDFFGLLDDDEGLFNNDLVDIGIGRMPVQSLLEADAMVDKIEKYYSDDSFGDWRNVISFIADDGDANDGNVHMWQADSLANIVRNIYPNINIQKFYLDNYEQISTPGGPRSPDMQESINRQITKGSLLVNYTGHGGELGWTQERILEISQINDWENINKLPLFMTATCKFSRFDDPEKTSAGEHVFLNPNGGAIALLSTTRLVYSSPNYNLNTKFINVLFESENGENPRLGDVFRKTKVLSGTAVNNRNFTLLGDPALKLAMPSYNIETTSVKDTIKALEEVTIEGEIKDESGNIAAHFNGVVYSTVFDKEITETTLGQESCTPMSYKIQDNIIYKGQASVVNGKFSFSFVVPKDITYDYGSGRLSYYAISDDQNIIDARGVDQSFVIGGISSEVEYDYDSPVITLFINNEDFVSGGLTDKNPLLLAFIDDFSGINTVGNGIGHNITCVLDNQTSNPIILNDFYESDKDDYKSGKIQFPFSDLDEGEHILTLKVWDVFNNSSESSIVFRVVDGNSLAYWNNNFIISDFINYPNPVHTTTNFYFEHNRADDILEVSLNIYSVSGILVKNLSKSFISSGYRLGPFSWDGNDKFGSPVSPGIYIATLNVNTSAGETDIKSTRIIILPQ